MIKRFSFAQSRDRRSWKNILFEWLVFIAIATWSTWPLAWNWKTCLPLGSERVPVVPIFNLWTLWWNVDRFDHGCREYWQAPIFYPTPDAFALSEPQPLSGLFAWVLWKFLPTPAAVFNSLLLSHLVLNGWAGARLLRHWRLSHPVALAGGLMLELSTIVHWHLGIAQLVPVWAILLVVDSLTRLASRPAWSAVIQLGLAAAIVHLLCGYYSVMLSLVVLAAFPWLLRPPHVSRTLIQMVAAAALAMAVTSPVVTVQWRTSQRLDKRPPRELVEQLSAQPWHFLRTPGRQWISLPLPVATAAEPWALSPGTLKLVLAAIALGVSLWLNWRRRILFFLTTGIVVSVLLAMGPTLMFADVSLWDLFGWYPGFAQLRNIYRFAIIAQLFAILLAAFGIPAAAKVVRRAMRRFRYSPVTARRAARAAAVVLSLAAILEVIPAAPQLHSISNEPAPRWIHSLLEHSLPSDVIAHLPFPSDDQLESYVPTAMAMYWQSRHGRRMINGYSGIFPDAVIDREKVMRGFPDDASLEQLRDAQVRWLIVEGNLNDRLTGHPELREVDREQDRRVILYQLRGNVK